MNIPSADEYAADPNSHKYDFVPYWLMQTTPDTGAANVEMGVVAMNVSTALKGASSDHATLTITIPIFTNSKTLQPGTEFLQSKAKKRQGDVEMPQPKARNIEPTLRGKGSGKGKQGQTLRRHCF